MWDVHECAAKTGSPSITRNRQSSTWESQRSEVPEDLQYELPTHIILEQSNLILIPRLSGYPFIIYLCLKIVTLYSKYAFKIGFSSWIENRAFLVFTLIIFSIQRTSFLYCLSLPNILNFHEWSFPTYWSKPIICRSLLLSIF